MKRFWQMLVPSARRPWRWIEVWPLVTFFVVFLGTWATFELTGTMLFARPWGLAVSGLAVWFWWWQVAGYAGLGAGRGAAALLVRLLLVGLFAMLLAEPRAVRQSDKLSVLYAVDVSDSVRSIDPALEYIVQSVDQHLPRGRGDEVGLVVFGKNAAVELPPRMNLPQEEGLTINTQIDRGASNLQQSLELSAAVIPDDVQGRIVLISDGVETEGNVRTALDALSARGVPVDVVPLDYAYENEVWLERLDLPGTVKPGETYEAAVVLSSLKAGAGELVVTERGQEVLRQRVDFQAGKNRYRLPIELPVPGYYEYTATIVVDDATDTLKQNNRVLNGLYIEGASRTLVVIDPVGDGRDSESLVTALRAAKRDVEVLSATEFPRNTSSLLPYDLIVFVNVAQDLFDTVQQSCLHDAVASLGCGFLMVGGENSFGPGGWRGTPIEDVLPVTMDVSNKKVLPKGALAIILHTCEFADGNTWGKRITKKAIEILSPQDEVGVLVFGQEGDSWLFPLTPAGKIDELVPKINGAEIGDMPSFASAMELGITGLLQSDASAKHMIIISDGDPSPPPQELLQKYIDNKITVSTVSIFPHGGQEIGLLRAIANVTGGRYYAVNDDPGRLPAIFIKESKTLRRNLIQTQQVTPQIGFTSPVLKGLGQPPNLLGYVLASSRDRAMTILQAPADPRDPSQVDPLLAQWQYRLGKTGAFTSDLSPNWGAQWQSWDHYQAFVSQLAIELSRVKTAGSLRLSTYPSGGQGVVMVEDFAAEESFLELQAEVAGPDGRKERLALRQVAPRRYQAQLPLWNHGRYQVAVSANGEDRQEQAFGSLIVPYSPEYLRLQSDRAVLTEIASRTGGRVLTGRPAEDNVFDVPREARRNSRPVFDWLLWVIACLIPLDVALRRIQVDWHAVLSRLTFRRSVASSQMMGTLLARKQAATEKLAGSGNRKALTESRPYSGSIPVAGGRFTPDVPEPTRKLASQRPAAVKPSGSTGNPAQSGSTNPPASPASGPGAGSTMGRLLAEKRKREQGSGEPPAAP